MADIHSKSEIVIVHYKGDVPVAMTHSNGHHTLYKLDGAMKRGDLEAFYETQNQSNHAKE